MSSLDNIRKERRDLAALIIAFGFVIGCVLYDLATSLIYKGINHPVAVALGHDVGHTPFGHAGEAVVAEITGHFAHNEQSLRMVEILERGGRGLNLTGAVRDGILNHTGKGMPSTFEGRIVRIADRIAMIYDGELIAVDTVERFQNIADERVQAFFRTLHHRREAGA